MELKLITITLNEVSMLTAASTSTQPTGSLISGLVNNSSGNQANGPDAVITNTEDAILLSYYIGYPGIPVKFAHKGGDTEIKTQQNKNAPKSQNWRQVHQHALQSCISNSPNTDLVSIFADTYGLLA